MSIERVFYCDGPDCETNVRTASSRPATFIIVTEDAGRSLHFCTWDCVLRHAAEKPPVEAIPMAN
jgi:hypothetical protein